VMLFYSRRKNGKLKAVKQEKTHVQENCSGIIGGELIVRLRHD
jgi:hypothetical protein